MKEIKNTELTVSKNSNSELITVDQIVINETEKNTSQVKVPKLDLTPITKKNTIEKIILVYPNNNSKIANPNDPNQSNKFPQVESSNVNISKKNIGNNEDNKSNETKDQNEAKLLDNKIPITYPKPQLSVINSIGIKVGPEIFVTIKKGSIFDSYKIGKTLGEGK